MWSERDPLDSLFWENALDDLGIYPAAVIRDGIEIKRTEWQSGYNAAVIELTERHATFTAWAAALTPEDRALVTQLLDSDGEPLRLACRDKTVTFSIQCNDTFMYACGDAEDCTLADLPEIARLWKAHGWSGLVAWIARKRNMEPVKEFRVDPRYLRAKADL